MIYFKKRKSEKKFFLPQSDLSIKGHPVEATV